MGTRAHLHKEKGPHNLSRSLKRREFWDRILPETILFSAVAIEHKD